MGKTRVLNPGWVPGCHHYIWRNMKNKKDYVIGIAYESEDTNVCYDDPKNRKPADKYGAVPGVIFKWIREKGGKEVEEWLKKC